MADIDKEASAVKKKKVKGPKSIFVNIQNTKYLTVRRCMKEFGYKFTENLNKNLLFWCDSEGTIEFTQRLQRWQFYNHFPGMMCIAHKVDLVRVYNKMARKLPGVYNFHPKTFIIPIELPQLQTYMQSFSKRSERTVIIKPDRGSQGRGILIIQDYDDLDDYDESAVAQYYIPPLLLGGKKFDMRIYVLITSCDPLRVYTFNEGMMRFCTEDYQNPKSSNLDEAFSHLTNFSLNKKNAAFDFTENKKYKTTVFNEMKAQGIDIEKVQKGIDNIVRLTLIAAQPTLASNYHIAVNANDGKSRCFEILGFDILLDENAHPWLLEVNCMPSLASYSDFDANLKSRVINGTLKILDLQPNFKKFCINRFKAMSTKRNTNFKQIFSPDKESEIAKTTEWRQLIPVVDDPETDAICKQALCASLDTPILRKTDQYKLKQISERKAPDTSRPSNKDINKPNTKLLKQRNINNPSAASIMSTASSVSNNALQSSIVPSSSSTAFNQNNVMFADEKVTQKKVPQLTRPMSNASRLSQPRTPRSVILANEARLSRINALDKRSQFHDVAPMYTIFQNGKSENIVLEQEERERIKNMKRQAMLASSVSMLNAIRSIIRDGKNAEFADNSAKKPPIIEIQPSNSPSQTNKVGKRTIVKIQSTIIPMTGIQCKR